MCTGIAPTTEKKSIGLPASLPPAGIPAAVSVFAPDSYRDVQKPLQP